MPAERTKYSRRSQADGPGIVWTLPVEPVGESGIGFAPNLTEDAFADLPPLVDAPDAPPLSPPPRRTVHTRKKSDNHIPRPPNAFILFRSSFIKSQRVSTEVETNHSTLSKIIGMTWKNLPEDERQVWRHKAMDAVAEHKRNFPTYAFRPKHTRAKKGDADGPQPKGKRKVREVYQDPRRCEKIAELLAEGKKGVELDRAIQEFDKYHVPSIVTRFEAPITARAYRRSSSCTVPNSMTPVIPHGVSCADQVKVQKTRSASTFHVDADSVNGSDGQLAPPSFDCFDSFSLETKQEPDLDTFDFSSFSFSNVAPPAPSLTTFDHKLEPPSPGAYTPVEPMDISAFIANEWLQHGASGNPFGGYPPVDYSAPTFVFPAPVYSPTEPNFCSNFKSMAFEENSYRMQDAIPGLAQLEADLASFMAQYSL
ncbi:hypothetical protein B0H17DRAFT_1212765 [Mycena rosella]|uniref:HMG box domain-containing protein n=1 Tax=Mycena rosella TaxID=1033263 RepID=A0AAD7CRX8_MYCRO|nr:hypothetical protein B0H17DRAFT_1212765 [Mycena rosella]